MARSTKRVFSGYSAQSVAKSLFVTSHGKTRKEFGHGKHGWHGVPNGFSPGIPRSPWPNRFSWRATERHGESSVTESADGTEYQTGFLRVFRAVRGQIAFRGEPRRDTEKFGHGKHGWHGVP